MGVCHLCQPDSEMPDTELIDHVRLFHPDEWGDGLETWPDGSPVIVDSSETVDEALEGDE